VKEAVAEPKLQQPQFKSEPIKQQAEKKKV
jgi:hypothetical protein